MYDGSFEVLHPIVILLFFFPLFMILIVSEFAYFNAANLFAHSNKKCDRKCPAIIKFFILNNLRITKLYNAKDGKTSLFVIFVFVIQTIVSFLLIIYFSLLYILFFCLSIEIIRVPLTSLIVSMFFISVFPLVILKINIMYYPQTRFEKDFPVYGCLRFKRVKEQDYVKITPIINDICEKDDYAEVLLRIMVLNDDFTIKKCSDVMGDNDYETNTKHFIEHFSETNDHLNNLRDVIKRTVNSGFVLTLLCSCREKEYKVFIDNLKPSYILLPLDLFNGFFYEQLEKDLLKNWRFKVDLSLKKYIK